MTSSTPSIFMDPEDTFRVESTVGMQSELMLRAGDPTEFGRAVRLYLSPEQAIELGKLLLEAGQKTLQEAPE